MLILSYILNQLSALNLDDMWLQGTIVTFWLGIILLIAENLHHFFPTDAELSRKIVHIGTGNVVLLAWWWDIPALIGVSAGIIAGIMAVISYKIPILPSINSVDRKSFGTFFYALSVTILIGWFWSINQPQYAAIGILIMSWGDGLAGLVGKNFGRHPYQIWGSNKSWEGSLTMCLVSFLVSISIILTVEGNHWQTWIGSILIAIVATFLESFSKFGIDNLTVPLGSATLALILWQSS